MADDHSAETPSTSFIRTATGLVRQLSATDIFAWSIIFFPWLTSWAGVFWVTPGYYQNVNYYASLAVWSIIAIVIVLLYWQLTVVMPRSGGDYIFISRALSSPLGFVASFLFLVSVAVSAGSGGFWALAESGTYLSFSGQVLNDTSIVALGNSMNPFTSGTGWVLMAVSLALLAVGTALVIRGGRALRIIIYALFAYGAFVLLLVLGIFLSSGHSGFVAAYSKYFQGGVDEVFSKAKQVGYIPGASLASLGAIVPLLFVSIGPYPVMQFVGGEIRNPRRSLFYGLVLAEIVSVVVWFGLTYLLDTVVGIPFVEAWTVGVGGGSPTVPMAFATVLNPSSTLVWLVVIGLFLGNIGWSWLALVFISRLFLAWSFDRVIPAGFAHVSDRFHTPSLAIIAGAMIAIIPMYFEFFTSFITAQVNSIFFYSVVWFLAAVAAAIMPFMRRGLYEAAVGRQRRGVPVLSVLGVIGAVLFAYLGYNSLTNPAIGPFSTGAQLLTGLIIATAVVIYLVSYYVNRRKGIDLSLLHAQIPPE